MPTKAKLFSAVVAIDIETAFIMQSNFGFNPSGKRAIITGGARGIGYEFAEQLLSAGAKVCLSDINENVGQDAAENLRLTYGVDKDR